MGFLCTVGSGVVHISTVEQAHAGLGAVLWLVLTNLMALLPISQAIYFAYRDPAKRLFMTTYATNSSLAMSISILYHFCQSATLCFAVAFPGWHLFDHIFATYNIAITIQLFIERDNPIWIGATGFIYLALTVLAVFARPFHPDAAIIVIAFGMVFLYIARLLVHRGRPMATSVPLLRPMWHRVTGERIDTWPRNQVDITYLLSGVLLLVFGSVFYLFDNNGYYNTMHGAWHADIFLAQWFILMGGSRDVTGWRTLGETSDWVYAKLQDVRAGTSNHEMLG